ncbi:MAG: CBS domain-containing protein [Sulfolobus sp.]|nr:CBS domain-containing protein [Sulfolobus sp.]
MIVRDLIKRKPVTAGLNATLSEVASLMKENDVGSVIITEGNKPVGIITERDLVYAVADGLSPETPVTKVMSYDPVKVRQDEDVSSALSLMVSRNIRHLVVVNDEGDLVGVISSKDMLKAVGSIALDLAIW